MDLIKLTNCSGKTIYLSVDSLVEIEEGCMTDDDKSSLEFSRVFGYKHRPKNGCAMFTRITTILGKNHFVKESYQEIMDKRRSLSWMIRKQDY